MADARTGRDPITETHPIQILLRTSESTALRMDRLADAYASTRAGIGRRALEYVMEHVEPSAYLGVSDAEE